MSSGRLLGGEVPGLPRFGWSMLATWRISLLRCAMLEANAVANVSSAVAFLCR